MSQEILKLKILLDFQPEVFYIINASQTIYNDTSWEIGSVWAERVGQKRWVGTLWPPLPQWQAVEIA